MSRVADGATTRRERIMDMLRYIRSRMPSGVPPLQVALYMSMAHGLTHKKTQEYVHEMTLSGIIEAKGGRLYLDVPQFKRLMELLGLEFDPSVEPYAPFFSFSLMYVYLYMYVFVYLYLLMYFILVRCTRG